ncbi:Hypothetical predicted protein [Cloeon dipterum]|uniref:Uncharacterized protein n=1 Tax=Cloeon dipterum TaxID=197152 RepID=A0A8S1DJQ8_9INSE|nr:Hypothetical predicted protein [Cloeon dipterum]
MKTGGEAKNTENSWCCTNSQWFARWQIGFSLVRRIGIGRGGRSSESRARSKTRKDFLRSPPSMSDSDDFTFEPNLGEEEEEDRTPAAT